MLVGTAITGALTRPATTLGRAPSMPATTMMTRAALRRSRSPSTRCRPATPTSYSLFFFNDTATTEIYTLSLHDALPISEKQLHVRCPVISTDDDINCCS